MRRGSSGTDIFAVGSGGAILHYDGSAWSQMPSGTTELLDGVWGSSGTNVFAVGRGATVLHYDGSSWSAVKADLRERGTTLCRGLRGVGGTPDGQSFIVGDGELILRHCPGGICPNP